MRSCCQADGAATPRASGGGSKLSAVQRGRTVRRAELTVEQIDEARHPGGQRGRRGRDERQSWHSHDTATGRTTADCAGR